MSCSCRDCTVHQVCLLLKKVKAYNAATDKFLQKVESGRARSKETYADLKAARKLPE